MAESGIPAMSDRRLDQVPPTSSTATFVISLRLYIGGKENWMDLRLTWAGCEYLESVWDEGKWEKVKRLIASKGEFASVETVKAAAALLLKQVFGN